MATKVSIPALIQALGGKENLAQATHCATRLRVTTRDKSKIDEAALKAIPGVLGVVNNGTQTQIIIGAEVNNVYKDFIAQTGVDEEAPIDENLDLKDELKNKKGKLLTRFFETVAAIFNPIVPALAGCGFLSALICIFMALGFDSSAPTFKTIIAISMAIFTFLPFLLAASAAKVFKMNMFVAMTICAGMMSSTWSGLINFLGVYPNRQYFIRAKPGFDILYADGCSIAVRPCISSDDRQGSEAVERHHSWHRYGDRSSGSLPECTGLFL